MRIVRLVLCLCLFVSFNAMAEELKAVEQPAETRATETKAGNINVTIEKLRNGKGVVYVNLFASDKGFPEIYQNAIKDVKIELKADSATAVLTDIPFGTYAISIFHDENSNGIMDSNWVGMPKEGFGASNNARPGLRSPTFDESKFELNAKEINFVIFPQYF